MASTWQNSFAQLKEFIKENPSIEITDTSVSIPGDVRPEFYRRFDVIRADFLKDNFPSSLEKGYELSKEFALIYKEAVSAGGLETISVRAAVNWFLQDPVNGLMRSLFDPVFNLIRGKLSEQVFIENAIQLVDNAFGDYFRTGYECWTVLGLMSRMQPDKNYHINSRDFHTDSEVSEGSTRPGMREDQVDEIVESKKIVFDSSSITTFIVPRTIFHSRYLGRYAAIHTDLAEAWWGARNKSGRAEWLNIKTLKDEFGHARLWPDLLVYTADNVEDLNLVADYAWVARPDLIIEVEETDGWYERGGLELARRHIAALKPRLGCFIICRAAPPAEAYDEIMSSASTALNNTTGNDSPDIPQDVRDPASPANLKADIRLIHAGYDFKALDLIAEALKGEKPTAD